MDKPLKYVKNLDPSIGPLGSVTGLSEEQHEELNPDLWTENNELKKEVKEKLQQIVDAYILKLAENNINFEPKDIVIVGSNANYNYTDSSDIDLHIVADTSIYKDDKDLAIKLYDAYKQLFNNKYDPLIYGHEVELYVEPDKVNTIANGIYSLNSGWLKTPEHTDAPDIDESALQDLVMEWSNKIEDATTEDEVSKILDDLYIMRQQSLLTDGEYGLENLCFKEIRKLGLLDELKNKKIEFENKDMSLTETKVLKEFKEINDPYFDDKDRLEELGFNPMDNRRTMFELRNKKTKGYIKIFTPENTMKYRYDPKHYGQWLASTWSPGKDDPDEAFGEFWGDTLDEVLDKLCAK